MIDDHNDQILNAIRRIKLFNLKSDKVKVMIVMYLKLIKRHLVKQQKIQLIIEDHKGKKFLDVLDSFNINRMIEKFMKVFNWIKI